jgi:hypothetical protein
MVDVLGMLEYRERKSDQNKIIVTIVDVDYDEACEEKSSEYVCGIRGKGTSDCITFYGYMKTTPRCLQEVWMGLMKNQWKFLFKGQDIVYMGY